MEKTTNSARNDGFGCISSESPLSLKRTEVLMTVMFIAVISLILAGGVAAAAEWLRPDRLFLERVETSQCAEVAAEPAR